MADLPPAFFAKPVAERGYLSDSGIDREALRERNLRVLAEQRTHPVEVAAILDLTLTEVERAYLDLGVDLPCPECGRPRYLSRQTPPRVSRTCGDRSCVIALGNRQVPKNRGRMPAARRRAIAEGQRRSWARRRAG